MLTQTRKNRFGSGPEMSKTVIGNILTTEKIQVS